MGRSDEESLEQRRLLDGQDSQPDVPPAGPLTLPLTIEHPEAVEVEVAAAHPAHVEEPAAACLPSTATAGPSSIAVSKEALLCRICFEEDTAANLAQPCACSGTQRFAHHACIQRWVHEKGNLRCEVCEQDYKGAFVVPPPPPPPPVVSSGEAIIHPLFGPMIIRVDDGSSRAAAMELYDEQDQYQQQNPGASWCFTFIIFVMFLVVLHHTTQVTDGIDGSSDSMSGSSGGMVGPGDMGGGPGDMSSASDDAFSASMTLILFWFITKILLFGIPLYTVMKIAARQAQREQYEAMFGAGAQVAEVGPHGRMMLRVVRADAPRGPYAV